MCHLSYLISIQIAKSNQSHRHIVQVWPAKLKNNMKLPKGKWLIKCHLRVWLDLNLLGHSRLFLMHTECLFLVHFYSLIYCTIILLQSSLFPTHTHRYFNKITVLIKITVGISLRGHIFSLMLDLFFMLDLFKRFPVFLQLEKGAMTQIFPF